MFSAGGKLNRDNGGGQLGLSSGSEHCVLLLPLNRCVSLCLPQHTVTERAHPNAFSKEEKSSRVVPALGRSLFPFLPPSKCWYKQPAPPERWFPAGMCADGSVF